MRPAEVLARYGSGDGTLAGMLRARAFVQPNAEFLSYGSRKWTWRPFERATIALATALARQGVRKGDRIVAALPNSDRSVALFFACARLGAIFVPINPELESSAIAYMIGRVAPKLVFVAAGTRDAVARAGTLLSERLSLVTFDEDVPGAETIRPDYSAPRPEANEPVSGDDTCLILFTSGTTGFPKGVMHRQRSFVLTGEGFVERMALQPQERMLCVLPFFHINALFYSLGGAVAAGAALIVAPRFSASTFWETVKETRATQVNLIAALGSILVRRPRTEFQPGHRLRKAYMAPLLADVYETFTTEFGVELVREGYGMTEIPGFLNQPVDEPPRIGTMGKLSRHPRRPQFGEARIVDPGGRDVAPNVAGELLARTPVLMQGYYEDPEATRAAFVQGWFRTGDIVRRDTEGWYTFVARGRDIIRRRGENISGAELDRAIGAHPKVLEVAAIPVPSQLGEDEILVAIVPVPESNLTVEELGDWFREHLPRLKQPRYVALVASLPHSATQRVEKFKLREDKELLAAAVELR